MLKNKPTQFWSAWLGLTWNFFAWLGSASNFFSTFELQTSPIPQTSFLPWTFLAAPYSKTALELAKVLLS